MTQPKSETWEKEFDKLTSELFSLNSPMHTFKYKEDALKSFIRTLIHSKQVEVLEEVEKAFKESCVEVAKNHGKTFGSPEEIAGFQKGSWDGFRAFYLDSLLEGGK